MSEQSGNSSPNNNSAGQGGNNNRRPNNNRRRHHNNNRPQGQQPQGQGAPQGQKKEGQAHSSGGPQQQAQGQNRRPQHNHNHNRPRPEGSRPQNNNPPQQGGGGFNFERIYEKYLNLLDQHIIARRKYHDLFYRADLNLKIKLEKNFYNTLNDIREFESRLAPDVKDKFEKRNNGLSYDRTYTSNHEIPVEGDPVPGDLPPAEPHYLQSQKNLDYKEDKEESVGTAEDYLKYKNF